MDTLKIRSILMASPSHGPDSDQILCSAVDRLDGAARQQFAAAFCLATHSLLTNPELQQSGRDTGLDCATHVLVHLQSLQLLPPFHDALLQQALVWVAQHPAQHTNDSPNIADWHARSSVLRLLRLLGYRDGQFWRKEFDFWVPELIKQPDHFASISRALMQSVRALGALETLHSRDFSKMFYSGLRGGHFPVHEVYAALDEVCKLENLAGPNVAEGLRSIIRRAAEDASSLDIGPEINETNRAQMERTLKSWVKNCLKLGDVQASARQSVGSPVKRRPVAGFPSDGVRGFYDITVAVP